MAEQPKQDQPEDIQDILSDLDAILSEGEPAAPSTVPPPVAAAPLKIELPTEPSGEEVPPPHAVSKRPTEPRPASKPAEPKPALEISLGPPASTTPRPAELPRSAEPPKPTPPKPELAPPPAAQPAAPIPVAAAVAAPADCELPAGTPKDQVRRVAYFYTFSNAGAARGFSGFLAQSARTISKKPLFLREVLFLDVGGGDPSALLDHARKAKAVAVLAVLEGWPSGKVEALSDACSEAGLLFRSVALDDIQKKSTAVDIIVDMMLLPGEG